MKAKAVKLPHQDLAKFLGKKQNLIDLANSATPSDINKLGATVDSFRKGVCFLFELRSTFDEQLMVNIKDGGDWKNHKVIIESDQAMKRTYYHLRSDPLSKRFVAHLYSKKLMLVIYHKAAITRAKKLPKNPSTRISKKVQEEISLKKQQGVNIPFASEYPANFIHADHQHLRALVSQVLAKTPECFSSPDQATYPSFGDLYVFRLDALIKSKLTIRQDGKEWVSYRTRRDQGSLNKEEEPFSRVWIKIYSESGNSSSKKCVITFNGTLIVLVYYYKVCCDLKLSFQELKWHLQLDHYKSRPSTTTYRMSKISTELFFPPIADVSYQEFNNRSYKADLCYMSLKKRLVRRGAESLIFPVAGKVFVLEGQQLEVLDGTSWYFILKDRNEIVHRAHQSRQLHRSLEYFSSWNLTVVRYFETCCLCDDMDARETRFSETELEQHLKLIHKSIFKEKIINNTALV